MTETELQLPIFDFSGNRLCLDFTNTVHDRSSTPRELLDSYDDLVSWSLEAHILTATEAKILREEAATSPQEAMAVLQRAIALREAIYRIFTETAEGASPDKADLRLFNTELSVAMAHAHVVPDKDSFTWSWSNSEQALERVLWPIVRSAADVLTSEDLHAVRMCAAEDCGWLFLDTSKNHSRRWCDMKSCGNRAKARKHYQQIKQAS